MSKNKNNRPKASFKKVFKIWLAQHAQAFIFSLGQLYKNPLGTLLTAAVIGISLALPAGFYLLLENVENISRHWEDGSDISLFLQQDHADKHVNSLAEQIRSMEGITEVAVIHREQALAEYRALSGFDEAIDLLEDNPLPNVLVVKADTETLSGAASGQLLDQLRQLPQVDSGQFDQQWLQRLFLMVEIVQRTIIILSVILGIAVLLIIGNTIRLAIYNRRQEIEIHKLFGATSAFIQRPFLYYGLLYGLTGSVMACALLELSVIIMRQPVERLSALYSSAFEIQALGVFEILCLGLIGALLGIFGAILSVQRHIKDIDPV